MLETDRNTELNNLVSQFEFNIAQYKGKNYDEAKIPLYQLTDDEIKIIEDDTGEKG